MARGNEVILKILGDASGAVGALKTTENQGEQTGKKMSAAFAAAGAAVAGFAVAVSVEGEKGRKAQVLLDRAVENTGHTFAEYETSVDAAIKQQAKFGNDSVEVRRLLTTFTNRMKDPQKAIEAVGLASDIAAQKGIDLAAAGDVVAKAYAGNKKVFAQYGIDVKGGADAAKAAEKATKAHAEALEDLWKATTKLNDIEAQQAAKKKLTVADEQRLRDARQDVAAATKEAAEAEVKLQAAQDKSQSSTLTTQQAIENLRGQVKGLADQEANTLGGRMDELRTKFENFRIDLGERFGPAVGVAGTALGTGIGLAGQVATVGDVLEGPFARAIGSKIAGAGATGALIVFGEVAAAVGIGIGAGLGLHVLIEKTFPEFNRALEEVGANLVDTFVQHDEELSNFERGIDEIVIAVGKAKKATGDWFSGIPATLSSFVRGISTPGRAIGGHVAGGSPYMVGENGPEMFVPRAGGTIVSAGGLRGGGGNVYNSFSFPNYVGSKRELATALNEFFSRGGALTDRRGRTLRPTSA